MIELQDMAVRKLLPLAAIVLIGGKGAGTIAQSVCRHSTDLGAKIVVAVALRFTIPNLSPTQNTCLFTDGNEASV